MILYLCGVFLMGIVYFRQNMESINDTVKKLFLSIIIFLRQGFKSSIWKEDGYVRGFERSFFKNVQWLDHWQTKIEQSEEYEV